jgi:hypothetical protein
MVLGQALRRLAICNGLTTSGVEQAFSKQCALFYAQRGHCGQDLERDETILCLDTGAVPRERLIAMAKKVWLRMGFGVPRSHETPRMDKGVRRPVHRLGSQLERLS